MVLSSSSTVYGQPENLPCTEEFNLKTRNSWGLPQNPDGQRSKLFLKEVAGHIQKAEPEWKIILEGVPNNQMTLVELIVYGQDLDEHSITFLLSQKQSSAKGRFLD